MIVRNPLSAVTIWSHTNYFTRWRSLSPALIVEKLFHKAAIETHTWKRTTQVSPFLAINVMQSLCLQMGWKIILPQFIMEDVFSARNVVDLLEKIVGWHCIKDGMMVKTNPLHAPIVKFLSIANEIKPFTSSVILDKKISDAQNARTSIIQWQS